MPITGPGYPGNNNTYIPVDLSGQLMVGFSRNPKKFHLPNYVQMVSTPNSTGYYLKLTAQEAARVVTVQDYAWPDGDPDRLDASNTESFNFLPFTTQRFRYPFRIGRKAAEQAVWPIVEQNSAIQSAKLMTSRTIRMLTVATNTANWQQTADSQNLSANHTNTATAIGGGLFDGGSSTSPYLKNGLDAIASLINMDTLGVVNSNPQEYFVIMNPTTARQIASSPEIHDYLKGSVWAMEELRTGQSKNGVYGLPNQLYGYNILVENCVQVSTRPGVVGSAFTQAKNYVMPNQTLLVVSKPQSIEGAYGAPSFSTLSIFFYQDDLTVETWTDERDRLIYGRVIEDTYETVTCPASGFLVTAATATPTLPY